MTNSEDCPDKPSSAVTPADEALATEMLKDLDFSGDDEGVKAGLVATSPKLRVVAAALKKRRVKKAASKSMKPSAIEEREHYAAVKRADGKGNPRQYNPTSIAPRRLLEGDFETEEEYERRYKREYARLKRGVDVVELETKEYLREVTTPEEKRQAKNKRERDRNAGKTQAQKDAEAARKKERRKEEKARKAVEAAAPTEPPNIS